MQGEAVSSVSFDTPFDARSAYRHLRAHLDPDVRRAVRSRTTTLHVSDFTDRLAAIADDVAEVKAYAALSGNDRLRLEANRQERESLLVLMDRVGIGDTDAVLAVRESHDLARSVAAVLRHRPDIALEVAAELHRRESPDVARLFEQLAARATVQPAIESPQEAQ